MALTADFNATQSNDLTSVVITDTSTANYSGETITGRELLVTKSDGTSETIPFPIDAGPGDEISYAVSSDQAISVELKLTPSSADPESTYSKKKVLLVSGSTEKCILQKTQLLLFKSDCKNILTLPEGNINYLTKITTFYEAAGRLAATGDLTGSQEAIEICAALCKNDCCND